MRPKLQSDTNCDDASASRKSEIRTSGDKAYWKPLTAAILLICVSVITSIISPNTIYVRQKIVLSDGGEMFNLWMRPNVDMTTKVYLFNVTNKEAFLKGNEKLRLQEVGPYIYKAKCEYRNPVFNNDEGTVSIIPQLTFEWAAHLNHRSEQDHLTLINMVMMSTASRKYDIFGIVRTTIDQYYKQTNSQPIMEQTVKNFLFGEENQLIKLSATLFPGYLKHDKVGPLSIAADTRDTRITFFTGEKNFQTAGIIANVNNKTRLTHWEAPCDRLAGTSDMKKFGNDVEPGKKLYFYWKSICRSVAVVPIGPPIFSNQNIPVTPYTFAEDALDNGQLNTENKCFCKKGRCLPFGLMDLSSCFVEYAVALSYPHFYNGDPSLSQNIDGLKPNESLHKTKLHLNLETGTLTSLSLRVQSNFFFDDLTDVEGCQRFSNMTVPMAWLDIGFTDLESTIALRIYLALRIFPMIEKGFICLTFLSGVYFMFAAFLKRNINLRNKILIRWRTMSLETTNNETQKVEASYTLE